MSFNEALQMMLGIGVIAAGLGYAYEKFFDGRQKKINQSIETETGILGFYQKQNDALTKLIKDHENEINKLQDDLHSLEAIVEEKDKKLQDYMIIFQNRDPQLIEILKEIRDFMKIVQIHNEKIDAQ